MRNKGAFTLLYSTLVVLFTFCACTNKSFDTCNVALDWTNSAQLSDTTLFVSYRNVDNKFCIDTISLKDNKGSVKTKYPIYPIGETSLNLYTSDEKVWIPLLAEKGRDIRLNVDFAYPYCYNGKGYPFLELRSQLIKQIKEPYIDGIKAYTQKNFTKAKQQQQRVKEIAMQFIEENANNSMADSLAREFFPGIAGYLAYHSFSKNDSISVDLPSLRASESYVKRIHKQSYLRFIPQVVDDAITKIAKTNDHKRLYYVLQIGMQPIDTIANKALLRSITVADSCNTQVYAICYVTKKSQNSYNEFYDSYIRQQVDSVQPMLKKKMVLVADAELRKRLFEDSNLYCESPSYFVLLNSNRKIIFHSSDYQQTIHKIDSLTGKKTDI